MTTDRWRILVTGWRDWPEHLARFVEQRIEDEVNALDARLYRAVTILEGECPYGGVDAYARRWALENVTTLERYPARPNGVGNIGAREYHARNQQMVDAKPHVCLAFPGPGGGGGTRDCYIRALRAGVATKIWPIEHVLRWTS